MPPHKLNRTQRAEIVARYRMGETTTTLGREFDVNYTRVSQIAAAWRKYTNVEVAARCGGPTAKALLEMDPPTVLRKRYYHKNLKILAAIVFRPEGVSVKRAMEAMEVTHQRGFEVLREAKRWGLITDDLRLVTHVPHRSTSRQRVAPESPFYPSIDKQADPE